MAITLPTSITHGSESRISDPTVHPRVDEFNNDNSTGYRRRHNNNQVWFGSIKMDWREYYTYFRNIWRNSRFRFSLHDTYSRRSIHSRDLNKISNTGTRNTGNRKNYRDYCYYYLALCLLSIAPVYAEPEVQNTSNPVAAATGNVTNQAVQFQNNGAPSRQILGPNISCNGATMTFSPFYMGNQTTPFDEHMDQQSYTVAENWGFQVNFMVPLDGSIVETCKALGRRQLAKMALDYELVRAKECAALQQKGFMLVPGSRIYHMCSDVVPIVGFTSLVKTEQNKQCTPIKEFRFPWQKKRLKCPKTFKKINLNQALNPLKFQENSQVKPHVAP